YVGIVLSGLSGFIQNPSRCCAAVRSCRQHELAVHRFLGCAESLDDPGYIVLRFKSCNLCHNSTRAVDTALITDLLDVTGIERLVTIRQWIDTWIKHVLWDG